MLKIESDEAVSLATELAELTGESIERVVVEAVRVKLGQEKDMLVRVQRVLDLASDIRALMPKPLPPSDLSHLYDKDTGLPT